MRWLLMATAVLALNVEVAVAQYSNASLDGPWILLTSVLDSDERSPYVVFDGSGKVVDFGIFDDDLSPHEGDYTVTATGAITCTLDFLPGVSFFGQMLTLDTAHLSYASGADTTGPIDLLRVSDPAACENVWTGSFVQSGSGTTYFVELTVDSNGSVTGATGLAPPVTGRMFYESGYAVGHLHTGETAHGWAQIGLEGDLVSDTMAGIFALDCSGCADGTFSFMPLAIEGRTWGGIKGMYRVER